MAGTHSATKGRLIAVIGDEVNKIRFFIFFFNLAINTQDTCVGFLLGGVGEVNRSKVPPLNFMVVDKNTTNSEIEETFKAFVKRDDIEIILINQNIAEQIRFAIDNHVNPIPAVLEIPSKDHPYDPMKDSILKRARGMFCADDYR